MCDKPLFSSLVACAGLKSETRTSVKILLMYGLKPVFTIGLDFKTILSAAVTLQLQLCVSTPAPSYSFLY